MKIAVFDFDGTLFDDETIPFLAKQWYKLGYSKSTWLIVFSKMLKIIVKYKLKIDKSYDKEVFRGEATKIFLSIFDGMSKLEVEEFFNKCRDDVFKLLNKDVIEEYNKKKEEGYYTVLLSGCFSEMLKQITDTYHFDKVICSKINFKENYIDNSADIEIVSGKFKVKHLFLNMDGSKINFKESYAYADSYYDRDLLELFGNPIAVNPDPILLEIANEKSWRVIKK
jgi:HAD superfamily hydrolase (TIGR01490 family)